MNDDTYSTIERFKSVCIKGEKFGFVALALVCGIYNGAAQADDLPQQGQTANQQQQQQQINQELKQDQTQIKQDLKQNPTKQSDTQMEYNLDQKIENSPPRSQ